MKIKILAIFLFSCVFLIAGCGKKISNSRVEFQQIASKVEMDTDPANVKEFEMYLPKGYIEYIPDSRKYTKTTVTLPSGKEKKVKCPYAQKKYKKNELEQFTEMLEFSVRSRCTSHSAIEAMRFFINYEKKGVLFVMPMAKIDNPKFNKTMNKLLSFTMFAMKTQLKRDCSYLKEYDLSSSQTKVNFLNGKLRKGPPDFMDLSLVENSTGDAFIVFCQQDDTTYNDIIAILLSIKPNSTNPVKSNSDNSVKSDSDSESKK